MKKVISIFLLLLMLVIGMHPVLAMHYCAGELYSFGVLSNEIEESCCGDMEMPQQEDNSCHTTPNAQENNVLPSHENCCDIQQIELSTDDYQHQVQQFNLNKLLPSYENVWLVLNMLIPTENDGITKISQYFPPGGLSLQNVDLLTYICIYRI
ncbi:MAG: hypothetical protein BGO34_06705 [Bacteroidia bacterium 44-10]|nr:MAG: hypothetical protein BGO34_06705 [Bacteroidia bacterium 44-10]